MKVRIVSFGIKNGIPKEVSWVLDCRLIRNPARDMTLVGLRGTDDAVKEDVLSHPVATNLVHMACSAVYHRKNVEQKQAFTLGIFCMAGHHRSVTITEEVARILRADGFDVVVKHRDIDV